MLNAEVISMPDKWEYPWYAAWDLAFHTISFALVDYDFAKEQLLLMLRGLYFHPNGQIPAYEWNFSDVNPPVHAWATLYLFKMERTLGRADMRFLERSFQGLMLNFNWWVNRKDPAGRNVFAGGFLGLDNIGVFDRSAQLPTGGSLEQADGTAWMAFYCQCMLEMSLILCDYDAMYEEFAYKFVQHFMWISYAMDRIGENHDEMWDEEDGFFYDLLRLPDGQATRLKVRSLVGLLPLCASTVFEEDAIDETSQTDGDDRAGQEATPGVDRSHRTDRRGIQGYKNRRLLSILNKKKLTARAGRICSTRRSSSVRTVSVPSRDITWIIPSRSGSVTRSTQVQYLPAESNTGMFGGNSNWRGPVWMPVNVLIVPGAAEPVLLLRRRLQSGVSDRLRRYLTLFEVAQELARRLASAFLRNADGKRADLRRHGQVPGRSALA